MANRSLPSLFLAALFSLCAAALWGQTAQSVYRLTWAPVEDALRYEVIIEREDDGEYQRIAREFSDNPYMDVILPPGNYRVTATPVAFRDLGEPQNRLPANGHYVLIEELRRDQRRINFSWSEVPEANAYIFTLFHQGSGGRRQIIRTDPVNGSGWALDNLNVLDQGTFIWQVEAVSVNQNGAIERRGRIGENTFIIDIPLPSRLRIEDIEIGILYGD